MCDINMYHVKCDDQTVLLDNQYSRTIPIIGGDSTPLDDRTNERVVVAAKSLAPYCMLRLPLYWLIACR